MGRAISIWKENVDLGSSLQSNLSSTDPPFPIAMLNVDDNVIDCIFLAFAVLLKVCFEELPPHDG